jgi:hypothetical protein
MSESLAQDINDVHRAHVEAAREAMKGLGDPKRGNTIWIHSDCLNTKIYRVFSKKWLVKLLESTRMGLMRPRRWEDPFENFLLRCTAKDAEGELIGLSEIEKDWFGQCWTLHEDSDAMWRIYSPDKDGIRVSTTIGRLFDAIYDTSDTYAQLNYFIGRVRYYPRIEIEEFLNNTTFSEFTFGGGTAQFAALLCVKRPEFEHESEIRILLRDQNESSDIREIQFDPNAVFDELILDPRLDNFEYECAKTRLHAAGWTKSVGQSQLYKIEPRSIPL